MSQNLLNLASESESTSGAVPNLSDAFNLPQQNIVAEGTDITYIVAEREFSAPRSPNSLIIEIKESTRPLAFNSNLFISTAGQVGIIRAFKDRLSCIFHFQDRPEFTQRTIQDLIITHGPPWATWTIPTWSLVTPSEGGVHSGLADLARTVERITKLELPQRAATLLFLARMATAAQDSRRDENVDQWADRLARDVSDADD